MANAGHVTERRGPALTRAREGCFNRPMAARKNAAPSLSARVALPGCAKGADSVELDPEGNFALLGGFPGLWAVDLTTGAETRRFRRDTGYVLWNARISRDGARVVGAFGDCTMQAWDARTGDVIATFPTHGAIVTRISLSRDGARALTVSGNKEVRLWDLVAKRELASHVMKKSFAIAGALSPDGRCAAYGGTDGFLRCRDLEANVDRWTAEGSGWIEDVDVSADGRFFVSGGRGKAVVIWNAATGERVRSLSLGANIAMVGVSPDGRFATARAGKKPPPVWDVETGALVATLGEHDGNVRSIRFGHDARSVATTDDGGTLRVFELLS